MLAVVFYEHEPQDAFAAHVLLAGAADRSIDARYWAQA